MLSESYCIPKFSQKINLSSSSRFVSLCVAWPKATEQTILWVSFVVDKSANLVVALHCQPHSTQTHRKTFYAEAQTLKLPSILMVLCFAKELLVLSN